MGNNFNINRMGLLMRRFYLMHRKTYFLGLGAGIIAVAIISTLSMIDESYLEMEMVFGLSSFIFFVGGLVMTSKSYLELSDSNNSGFFLSLPATSLEKVLSHWITTGIIYWVMAIISVWVSVLLSSGIAISLSKEISTFPDLFVVGPELAFQYLIVHSIFFLGAATFKRYPFFKTIIASFVICLAVASAMAGIMYLIMGDAQVSFHGNVDFDPFGLANKEDRMKFLLHSAEAIGALFLLTTSYLKLKEREV
jgi:hypothetical protein